VARPYVARKNLAAGHFCNAIDPELRKSRDRIPTRRGQQLLLEKRRVGGGPKRCHVGGDTRDGYSLQELTSRQIAAGHSFRLLGIIRGAGIFRARPTQPKQLSYYTKLSGSKHSAYHIKSSGTL